jgi:hypothetical protein
MFTFDAYWRVILSNGRKINGYEKRPGLKLNEERPIDWSLDIVSTRDYLNIKELQLVYPGVLRHVSLKITEPGTAFAFVRQVHGMDMSSGRVLDHVEAHIIGRVTNKEEGICEGYIWDRVQGLLQYEDVSIYEFPSWRPGLMPPGRLSLEVLGLRL